jgi:hypothetical protein
MAQGARLDSGDWQKTGGIVLPTIYGRIYYGGMQHHIRTPVGFLQQIAEIERMEAGKLCVMGQGKDGPYYNLQCREKGKPVSRYVPRDQVETVQQPLSPRDDNH